MVGPEWLGTTDAAKYLGLSAVTFYRLIDDGQLPAYRFGRVIRIKASDLDAFIESHRIEPGTITYLYPEGSTDEAS